MDSTAARNFMVDSQVRPNKVSDRRILDAMRTLPREKFVPAAAQALAYADEDVPLGRGRCLIEPMVIARLVQLTAVKPGERVLVAACGTGYGAALLAACGAAVTAVDDDTALLARARAAAAAAGVTFVEGDPAAGWPGAAPYDIVFVDGAIEHVPPALAAQVKRPGGRFVAVQSSGRVAQAVLGIPGADGLILRPAFDCATPVLPAFRRAPGFVF